jgi:broad specificity phosphatase PhoE
VSSLLRSGPRSITLVRHGESVANVAEDQARVSGADELGLSMRDADVTLSPVGRRQARALGHWVLTAPETWRPTVVFSSPYRRALQTAQPTLSALGLDALIDERLRERDLGVFDGITRAGMLARWPAEAERHARLGKFYYRPPGGESWADVILRIRGFLTYLLLAYPQERVWVFSHRATIMAFRAALERLPEEELLLIDGATPLPNAALTQYERQNDGYVLAAYADRRALRALARTEGSGLDRTGLSDASAPDASAPDASAPDASALDVSALDAVAGTAE